MLKIREIDEMSIEDVIKSHDNLSGYSISEEGWLKIYNNKKNELLVEEQRKLNKQMLLYTKAMTVMTAVVLIATLVSLGMVIFG